MMPCLAVITALYDMQGLNNVDLMERALSTAEKLSPFCKGPMNIVHLEKKKSALDKAKPVYDRKTGLPKKRAHK